MTARPERESHRGAIMARKAPKAPRRQWVWMRVCRQEDIDLLRKHLDPKGPLWSEWEYKLRGGNIIIYSPVIPWNEQYRPDPSRRHMAMHLRIVPTQPGPYQLEYRRHTEQWWPLGACPPGSME